MAGTTNKDKPFEVGEKIEYCDEHYIVKANFGTSGHVQEMGEDPATFSFHWEAYGEECRRVE